MFITLTREANMLPLVISVSQIVTIAPSGPNGSLICLEDRVERIVTEGPETVKQLAADAIRLTLGQHFDVLSTFGPSLSAIGDDVEGLADRVEGLGTGLDAIAVQLAAFVASQ